jgi:hypothetical protein
MSSPKGFRQDIMVLHTLSDLMEKHPTIERPRVSFDNHYNWTSKEHQNSVSISWYLSTEHSLKYEFTDEDNLLEYNERWAKYDRMQNELRRVDLEKRIAAILDGIEARGGVEGEWEKNDPTDDSYSYTLSAKWMGANVRISCNRDAVCEKVIVLETEREEEVPDPEIQEKVLQAIPKVKRTVKETISEWQCNTALAEKTAPKYAVTTKTEVTV